MINHGQPLGDIRAHGVGGSRGDSLIISQSDSQLLSQLTVIIRMNVVKHATTSKLDLELKKLAFM